MKKTRDTLRYRPFVALFNGRRPSLKKLSERVLSVKVQEGEHSSVSIVSQNDTLHTLIDIVWVYVIHKYPCTVATKLISLKAVTFNTGYVRRERELKKVHVVIVMQLHG